MKKEIKKTDKKLIRFEIQNYDDQLNDIDMEDVINEFSIFTKKLLLKYKISGEKFKITIGRNMFEKLLNL